MNYSELIKGRTKEENLSKEKSVKCDCRSICNRKHRNVGGDSYCIFLLLVILVMKYLKRAQFCRLS